VKSSDSTAKRALDLSRDQECQRFILTQSRRLIVALAVSIALALALYAPILRDWIVDLETDPSYSFALLLPFVAGYVGYRKLRGEGRSADEPLIRPDTAGILVVLGGCALLVAGDLTTIVFLSRLSFLVMIAGFTIAFLGRSTMRSLAFPYGILFFGLPLPALIYLPLTFQLQLLSSVMATHMLHLIGVSVLREGNVLILQNVSLEVVEACAGLHSLFALGALACIIGYLFLSSLARRVLLFISAIPIAIGLNAGRISSAAIAAHLWGPGAAEGFAHASMGVAIFAIGTLIILFVSSRLADPDRMPRAVAVATNSARKSPGAPAAIPVLAVIAILLVTFAMHREGLRTVQSEPLREPLASFPRDIENWHGRDISLTESQFSSLGTRDVLMREYSDDQQDAPVLLHVAFYPRQQQGSTMHSPLHCIPGSGWEVERRTLTTVPLGGFGSPFDANEVVFRHENDRILVVYWYLEQGTPQASEFKGAFQTMWNSATAGRSYGCLIRFSTPITTTTQEALARASALVAAALPILIERFLPAPAASKSAPF
jgi:exosortase D (VPLPA-CTERM-specific)